MRLRPRKVLSNLAFPVVSSARIRDLPTVEETDLSSPVPQRVLALPMLWRKKAEESASYHSSAAEPSLPYDEHLMEQVQTGDQDALGVLFDRYSRTVLGISYRVLRDRGEAEEMVQEIFLYLHRNAAQFDCTRGTVKAWLVQIAYHRALNRRIYLARRRFYDGTDLELVEDNVSGTVDLEQELGSKLAQEQLRKAFGVLGERQRTTVEMFFFEGLSLREIAQRLDEPLFNVRHHYYRALEKLRKSSLVASLWKE